MQQPSEVEDSEDKEVEELVEESTELLELEVLSSKQYRIAV